MKKYLPLLLVFLAACSGSPSGNDKQEKKETGTPQLAAPVAATGCEAMVIFQEGKVIENVTRDTTGKITAQSENRIVSVRREDSILISTMEISAPGAPATRTQYRCNGQALLVSMSSLMGNVNQMTDLHSNDAQMEFPLDMKVGDQLKDTVLRMSFKSGNVGMTLSGWLRNRHVDSREQITTPAGTWDCFKISSDIYIESMMQGAGVADNKPLQMRKKLHIVTYFTPGVGLLRLEVFNGVLLNSISEVTAIR